MAEDQLQQCLTRLGCSVTERERRCFLFYSQFYEQILQQQTQLLGQREQVSGGILTASFLANSALEKDDFFLF